MAEFTLWGSGYGHAVGMSQYGAYGQALEGATADEIVSHYYTGTSVRALSDIVADGLLGDHRLVTHDAPLWVGLVQSTTSVEIEPIDGFMRVCQTDGGATVCAEVEVPIRVVASGDDCTVRYADIDLAVFPTGDCTVTVDRGGAAAPAAELISVDEASCVAPIGRTCLAHGAINIRGAEVASGFHVSASMGLEEYLYGLDEMPSSWPAAALEAQAIAGRTYAAYRILQYDVPSAATATDAGFSSSRKADCWCHLYSTVRDQNFAGYKKEGEADSWTDWGDRWVAAVDATQERVATHPTADLQIASVIQAFYHSSSGGQTEPSSAVWGSAHPYLVSVDDHWSVGDAVSNPYAAWTKTVTAAEMADALGWDSVLYGYDIRPAPGSEFGFVGTDAGQEVATTVTGTWLYSAFRLPSPQVATLGGPPPVPLHDIATSVHRDSIVAIYDAGISLGCTVDQFCPSNIVTRGQMASFVARALNLEPVAEDFFADDDGTTHEMAINSLTEAGIATGCTAAEYCPGEPMSRVDMASFLARALDLEPVADGQFVDIGHLDETTVGYINAISAEGITLGCTADGSQYCPDDAVPRGQMASFLDRAFLRQTAGE